MHSPPVHQTEARPTFVKDYYLANRPLVDNANVLGIGCITNESIRTDEYTNIIAAQIQAWLTSHPTKRPAYVILFPDIPSQVVRNNQSNVCGFGEGHEFDSPSVQVRLNTECATGWSPFVTSINFRTTNDCRAYIDKLELFGTNCLLGHIALSAQQSGYANINYFFDCPIGFQYYQLASSNAVVQAGIPATNVFLNSSSAHITSATNVAGYMTAGANGGQGRDYAIDGGVVFSGQSTWFPILTIESFNGQRCEPNQGTFLKWFSANAFGGANYSNTPICAVTHVAEPGGPSDAGRYFGLWARNRNFATCAWNSRTTIYFQAIGDPFVKR